MAAPLSIPEAQAEEIRNLLKSGTATPKEIAATYGVSITIVNHQRRKAGLVVPRKKTAPTTLTQVDQEIQDVLRVKAEAEEKLMKLRNLREELALHFEFEDGMVVVSGIGNQPFKAPPIKWFNFLNNGGGVKLREFVSKTLKQ